MAQMQQQIMQTVSNELNEAVEHQADATEYLNNMQIDQATGPQTKAIESLKRALEAFPPQQQQQDSEQQEQQEQQKQNQQQQQEANEQEQQQEQPQQLEQQKPPDATAQDILDQEKERKQQQKRVMTGKYEAVDKDW